jgi:hypothetical protein
MAPFHRPLFGSILWATLLAALAACGLTLTVCRNGDFWSLPGPDGGPDEQAPADVCRDVLRRLLEKQRLAGEVIEGRLSLTEAAAAFRHLDEQPPAFNWSDFRRTYPGATDDERHCRAVIVFVRAQLQIRPGADPALLGRLEAELHDLVGRGGFRLPPPEPLAAPAQPTRRP